MKQLVFLFFLVLAISTVKGQAQNTAEWLRQKNTQKKYLLQQIAALQIHLESIKKGYRIARTGLHAVSDLKNGEFNLHSLYFQSLKKVNPTIRKYGRIAEISATQVKILKDYKALKDRIQADGMYSRAELDYIDRASGSILDNCEQVISDLIDVVSDGKLELKDDERLERIDQLYNAMQENADLSRSFSYEVMGISQNRASIHSNIQSSRRRAGLIQ
ncbi:hypothetical protein [Sphingobacterium sp. BIGb0116]|uniref:hypothetical protein n=1 Tax=Sphingobacterium sp. BIGb0116 TaxID=2940619 RepID=UPI00216A47F7|nr:hypothetical protein [Sphingobacterium sp. BIGb0116]MCS4165200.1 hypothetical protein [Sphingobacterium sp. BIGb0116]